MQVSASAWKNSVNAVTWGVGMLLSSRILKSLNSIEKIQPRIMLATFNGNPSTTIISCYSSTITCDETDVDTFYNERLNVLTIRREMNALIGKKKNVYNKFSLYNSSNRNSEHLTDFILENRLTCLKTRFQKSVP